MDRLFTIYSLKADERRCSRLRKENVMEWAVTVAALCSVNIIPTLIVWIYSYITLCLVVSKINVIEHYEHV